MRVLFEDKLRGHVEQRPDVRPCLLFVFVVFLAVFCETKIPQLWFPFRQQNVLRFYVPMEDTVIVEGRSSRNYRPDRFNSLGSLQWSILQNVPG